MKNLEFVKAFDACVSHETADEARQKIAELTVRLHQMETQGYARMSPGAYKDTVKQYEAEIKRLKKFVK